MTGSSSGRSVLIGESGDRGVNKFHYHAIASCRMLFGLLRWGFFISFAGMPMTRVS
jgi:hypothetical protein